MKTLFLALLSFFLSTTACAADINKCVDMINDKEYKIAEDCISKIKKDAYRNYWLSLLFLEKQEYKKALEYAEKAYRSEPDNNYYQLSYGNLLIIVSKNNKSIKEYLIKDNISSDAAPYKLTRGRIYQKTDKLEAKGVIVKIDK